MKVLFIVGNGFDLSHGIPSAYKHFKKYMEFTYLPSEFVYPDISVGMGKDGETVINPSNSASLLQYCLDMIGDGSDWSDFENDLAKITIDDVAPAESDFVSDEDDDSFPRYYHIMEDFNSDVLTISAFWSSLFKEWVENVVDSIDEYDYQLKKEVMDILNKEDVKVLSFNYTPFIENKYNFHNVCHIHGIYTDEFLVFGHGEEEKSIDFDYDNHAVNAKLHNMYKKDTNELINKNLSFFDEINSDTLEIYCYGFGFGKADLPYVKEICKRVSKRCIWYLKRYRNIESSKPEYCLNKYG